MTHYQQLKHQRGQWWKTAPAGASYRDCPVTAEIEQIELAKLKTIDSDTLLAMFENWNGMSLFHFDDITCDEWQVAYELQDRGCKIILF